MIDSRKYSRGYRQTPYKPEDGPCPAGMHPPDTGKNDHCICSADEIVYSTVVYNLHDFLAHVLVKSVIDAAHCVQDYK